MYEIKTKMEQEHWLQLKMLFLLVVTWKLLFSWGDWLVVEGIRRENPVYLYMYIDLHLYVLYKVSCSMLILDCILYFMLSYFKIKSLNQFLLAEIVK